MKTFAGRFLKYLSASFFVLLSSLFVFNYHGPTTLVDLLPGIILIFLCSMSMSVVCATLIRTDAWWAILVPQFCTSSMMLLVYFLIA
jgi:hypothetical protein